MVNKENFEKKYTETNFITNFFITNFYDKLEKLIINLDVNKILEVGCGHGFSTERLNNFFIKKYLEASDYDEKLVMDARARNPQNIIYKESIYSLQRESSSFDLVICLEVLEHLDDPEMALKELGRVTNKFCLLSVPNEPLWRIMNIMRVKYISNLGNTPGHINHWSRKKFLKLLSKYFKVINYKNSTPWIIVLVEKI